MICPTCKTFKASTYCADCGAKTLEHNCPLCTNQLSLQQRYCEKCGMKCPQPPRLIEIVEAQERRQVH